MTRNDLPRKGALTLVAAVLAACGGSGAADTAETTLTPTDTTMATTAPAEPTSTSTAPESTEPAETTTSAASETTVEPGVPQLLYGGASVTADHEACAGADGAVVFRSDDDSTMVGFEEGVFLRYLDAAGEATDTSDVTVAESGADTSYTGDLPIGGDTVIVTIVLPTDMSDLPECTFG